MRNTNSKTMIASQKAATLAIRRKRGISSDADIPHTDISAKTERNKGITIPCTDEQYRQIIETLWNGSAGGYIRKNRKIAILLQFQANCGLRIGDICNSITLNDIIYDNGRYRFHLREHKTGKLRVFTVDTRVYNMLYHYAKANGYKPNEPLFPMTVRNVQKCLEKVTDFYGMRFIGTHSFRKRFAMRSYELSKDLNLVRTLLQHADTATTVKYLGISASQVDKTLKRVTLLFHTRYEKDNDSEEDIKDSVKVEEDPRRVELVYIRCGIRKDLLEKLDNYCRNSNVSINEFIENCIESVSQETTALPPILNE